MRIPFIDRIIRDRCIPSTFDVYSFKEMEGNERGRKKRTEDLRNRKMNGIEYLRKMKRTGESMRNRWGDILG